MLRQDKKERLSLSKKETAFLLLGDAGGNHFLTFSFLYQYGNLVVI